MATDLPYWTIGISSLAFLLILPTIMGFFSKNKFDVKGKTVLLTGASEGMGLSVAKQLAQKGANIIIVARNVGKLEEALAQVQSSAIDASQRFQYISSDVTDPDGAARVVTEVIAWNGGHAPDIVWCIAGGSVPDLFLNTPRESLRRMMDINYWSCVDMSYAILGEWLAPSAIGKGGEKHLIFTSSVLAFYSIVGYTAYSPAKSAIKSFSDTLAQEVLLYGDEVKIHTVFPGTILSPGYEQENILKPEITHKLEETDPVQTCDEVAKISIEGLEKGQYLVTVGWMGDAMRACAWGGSKRNNWLIDTIMTWITSIAWMFIASDLDGKVRSYGKKNGHPSTFVKKSS